MTGAPLLGITRVAVEAFSEWHHITTRCDNPRHLGTSEDDLARTAEKAKPPGIDRPGLMEGAKVGDVAKRIVAEFDQEIAARTRS